MIMLIIIILILVLVIMMVALITTVVIVIIRIVVTLADITLVLVQLSWLSIPSGCDSDGRGGDGPPDGLPRLPRAGRGLSRGSPRGAVRGGSKPTGSRPARLRDPPSPAPRGFPLAGAARGPGPDPDRPRRASRGEAARGRQRAGPGLGLSWTQLESGTAAPGSAHSDTGVSIAG